jgi:hypothetical protein
MLAWQGAQHGGIFTKLRNSVLRSVALTALRLFLRLAAMLQGKSFQNAAAGMLAGSVPSHVFPSGWEPHLDALSIVDVVEQEQLINPVPGLSLSKTRIRASRQSYLI